MGSWQLASRPRGDASLGLKRISSAATRQQGRRESEAGGQSGQVGGGRIRRGQGTISPGRGNVITIIVGYLATYVPTKSLAQHHARELVGRPCDL